MLRRDVSSGVAAAQGLFWLGAGLWPLLHLKSFAVVTGPKPEGWLVKGVASLMVSIGAALLGAGARRRVTPELRRLAISSATALGALDVFYVAKRRISPTYLLDAAAQAVFLTGWAMALGAPGRAGQKTPAARRQRRLGQWDIAPGESLLPSGRRDVVHEASMGSFPASDPPGW